MYTANQYYGLAEITAIKPLPNGTCQFFCVKSSFASKANYAKLSKKMQKHWEHQRKLLWMI